MSHDPFAQTDQNLLEMIEHSPVGAIPHTPTHQDALRRLIAAHQVYVSADHKDGYVTARSLAAQPLFHPQNLESFLAGKIDFESLEPDASIFSRYVQSLPPSLQEAAEACRPRVVAPPLHHRIRPGSEPIHDPLHTLFLIPGGGPNPGLPGNYLHGSVFQTHTANGDTWAVQVHDALDGVALSPAPSQSAAFEKLQELLASAPFLLSELDALDFEII